MKVGSECGERRPRSQSWGKGVRALATRLEPENRQRTGDFTNIKTTEDLCFKANSTHSY